MKNIEYVKDLVNEFEAQVCTIVRKFNLNENPTTDEIQKFQFNYQRFCQYAYPLCSYAELSLKLLDKLAISHEDMYDQLSDQYECDQNGLNFSRFLSDLICEKLSLKIKTKIFIDKTNAIKYARVVWYGSTTIESDQLNFNDIQIKGLKEGDIFTPYIEISEMMAGNLSADTKVSPNVFQNTDCIFHENFHVLQSLSLKERLSKNLNNFSEFELLQFRIDQLSVYLSIPPKKLKQLMLEDPNNYANNPTERSALEFGYAATCLIFGQKKMNPDMRAEYIQYMNPNLQIYGAEPSRTAPLYFTL